VGVERERYSQYIVFICTSNIYKKGLPVVPFYKCSRYAREREDDDECIAIQR